MRLGTIRRFSRVLFFFLGLGIVLLFMPWTQNVFMQGNLTTLEPETRPQEIQSVIEGKIDHWYVREGMLVQKGDTIARISEIKDQYWDPFLLERTEEQLQAKHNSTKAYQNKIDALERQIAALRQNLKLKTQQTRRKIEQIHYKLSTDSAAIEAARTDYSNFKAQYERGGELYKQNLISKTELESRQNKMQSAMAKLNKAENDFAISQNEFLISEVELNTIEAEYLEKIFKIQSEIQTAVSDLSKVNEELSKLNNAYSNYVIRAGNYFILAPQDGQIVRIHRAGLGENVKAGEALASITPEVHDMAVAFYIQAVDLPLFEIGRSVRIQFDGWPSVVFSGWPGTSFGTFGGTVKVIDNNISPNGRYRILVSPSENTEKWPELLAIGGGAKGYALLKDVPVWYELWRRLNGFPPEFYRIEDSEKGNIK
ncbi:MAG: HlyD family efflux transporter periplasmic adaptor subunit [Bacteroidetes bacterium]|nr:HlyD family efflux transporter periplasmic adaptor subunit [Bacteroidota bacterium]